MFGYLAFEGRDGGERLDRDADRAGNARADWAVLVLREVFEMPNGEIAQAIGKSAATVRQLARRAREHVAYEDLREPRDCRRHLP